MEPQSPTEEPYPVRFDVEYPDRELSRLSTAFRIFAAIPILILIAFLTGPTSGGWGHPPPPATRAPPGRLGPPHVTRRPHRRGDRLHPHRTDDRLPPEVPGLVVRLEPGAAP